MKGFFVVMAAAFIGNAIADRFVLRYVEGGPGFVDVEEGLGMDDVVKAAVIAATAWGIKRFVPRV